MPLIERSTFCPPIGLGGAHTQTILPALLRKVRDVRYTRTRLDTPDGDFIDIDASLVDGEAAALVLHGLESSSGQPYMRGMVRALNRRGIDAYAMNFRGCSGDLNRLPRFYHSGETGDLRIALDFAEKQRTYKRLHLVGFSLGGNVVLKFLGDRADDRDLAIASAVAISAPVELGGCSRRLEESGNRFYMRRFIRTLALKAEAKQKLFPAELAAVPVRGMRSFAEFDDAFTAPLHGFKDARDYWERCSSVGLLPRIRVPALLLNARNDPFLASSCFPEEAAKTSDFFHMETPESGGHLGFYGGARAGEYWHERRALEFLLGKAKEGKRT